MAYKQRINAMKGLSNQDKVALTAEFDALYADIADMRTKYTALRALLAAATALGAGYNTGTGLTAATFTQT